VLWNQSRAELENRFHYFGARAKFETVYWGDTGIAYGFAFRGDDNAGFVDGQLQSSSRGAPDVGGSWSSYHIPEHLHRYLPPAPTVSNSTQSLSHE
jgi:hypothetical protein